MATLAHTNEAPKVVDRRSRTWGTIVYQESVNPDYLCILHDSAIPCVISPLHDRDLLEDGSGYKKPHRHILLRFDSVKSRSQVKEFVEKFGGVGAEDIKSMEGSVVYLWHGNAPDKAQYKKEDCICYNGFDINRYLPRPDPDEAFVEVIQYIEQNDIVHFSALVRDLSKDRPELLRFCRTASYAIVNYLKSREHELYERDNPNVPKKPRGFKYVQQDFKF